MQVRTQNVTVNHLSKMVIANILKYESILVQGALIVLDEEKARVRILPLGRNSNHFIHDELLRSSPRMLKMVKQLYRKTHLYE